MIQEHHVPVPHQIRRLFGNIPLGVFVLPGTAAEGDDPRDAPRRLRTAVGAAHQPPFLQGFQIPPDAGFAGVEFFTQGTHRHEPALQPQDVQYLLFPFLIQHGASRKLTDFDRFVQIRELFGK